MVLWDTYIEAAKQYFQDDQLEKAEQLFRTALTEADGFAEGDPRKAANLTWLAQILLRTSREDEGYEMLARSLESHSPETSEDATFEALVLLAEKAEKDEDKARAEELWTQVLKLAPGRPDASFRLGRLYAIGHRYQEAQELLQVALSHSPGDVEILKWSARCHLALGDPTKAQECCNQAVEALEARQEKDLEIFSLSARILHQQGLPEKALPLYEKALAEATEPEERRDLFVGQAEVLDALESFDEAEARLQDAFSLGCEDPSAYLLQARLCLRGDRLEEARKAIDASLGEAEPDLSKRENLLLAVEIAIARGDLDEQEKHLLALVAVDEATQKPPEAAWLESLIEIAEAKGEREEAIRREMSLIRHRLEHGEPDFDQWSDLVLRLSDFEWKLGEIENAIELQEEVLEHTTTHFGTEHQKSLALAMRLAQLCREGGRVQRAERFYFDILSVLSEQGRERSTLALEASISLANLYRENAALEESHRWVEQSRDLAGVLGNASRVYHPSILTADAQLQFEFGNFSESENLLSRVRELSPTPSPRLSVELKLLNAKLVATRGERSSALELLEQTLETQRELLGEHHPDLARTLAAIAGLQSDEERAIELHRQALERFERMGLWLESEAAEQYSFLADIYFSREEYQAAETYYERSLEIQKRVFGDEAKELGPDLNNLGQLYFAKGDLEKAEPVYEQALRLLEQGLGREHPDVLLVCRNLANLHKMKGALERAEGLLRRVVADPEKSEPAKLSIDFSHLAEIRSEFGDLDEAETLYKKSIELSESVFGPSHRNVAAGLNNLALMYMSLERYRDAEPLARRALGIFREVLGEDHPTLVTCLSNLCDICRSQGKYALAKGFASEALEIAERVLGEDNDVSQTCRLDLGNVLGLMGNHDEALETYEVIHDYYQAGVGEALEGLLARILVGRAEQLLELGRVEEARDDTRLAINQSLSDPDLVIEAHILASRSEHALGDVAAARGHLESALEFIRVELGGDHQSLALPQRELAWIHKESGEHDQAWTMLGRVLELQERSLGPNHLEVAKTMAEMGDVAFRRNDLNRSETLYRRAKEVATAALGPDHYDLSSMLLGLGRTYMSQTRQTKAESNLLRAVELSSKARGKSTPLAIQGQQLLADLYFSQERWEEAGKALTWVVDCQKEPEPTVLRRAGLVKLHQGKWTEAIEGLSQAIELEGDSARSEDLAQLASVFRRLSELEKSLEFYERAAEGGVEGQDELRADYLVATGELLTAMGRLEEAEKRFTQVLEMQEKSLGADHPKVAVTLHGLADLCVGRGDFEAGEAHHSRALEIRKRTAPGSLEVASSLGRLARFYKDRGNHEKAQELLRKAAQLAETNLGSSNPELAPYLVGEAELLLTLNNFSEAVPLFERALELWQRDSRANPLDVARANYQLGLAYQGVKRGEDALRSFEKAEPSLRGALPEDHPELEELEFAIGQLLTRMGQLVRAEPLLSSVLEKRRQSEKQEVSGLVEALAGLAACFLAQERADEAHPLLKEAVELQGDKAKGEIDLCPYLLNLGRLLQANHSHQRAREILEKVLADAESSGDERIKARALGPLAEDALRNHELELALDYSAREAAAKENLMGGEHPQLVEVYRRQARIRLLQGQLDEAEESYKKSLGVLQNSKGEETAEYAATLVDLAELYREKKLLSESEALHRRAFETRKKLLGGDSKESAESLHFLGRLYHLEGKHETAESFLKRALDTQERVLGEGDAQASETLISLGQLYRSTDRTTESEDYFKRALEMRERILGLQHPQVAAALECLADLYRDQEKFAEAEPLYGRAVESLETSLGASHLAVADSLSRLGQTYRLSGRMDDARETLTRALEIRKTKLGASHRLVADSLLQLAWLDLDQERRAEAETQFNLAHTIVEAEYGAEHLKMAPVLDGLGALDMALARNEQARDRLSKSLEIRIRDLGEESIEVADAYLNLAQARASCKGAENAEAAFKKALELRGKLLGTDHPKTAASLAALGSFYGTQGNFLPAVALTERSLEIRERAFGKEHPDLVGSLLELANFELVQGQPTKAEKLTQRALDICQNSFGDDHPRTADALFIFGEVKKKQHQYSEAEYMFDRVLEIRDSHFGPHHTQVALCLSGLADLYMLQERLSVAERFFKRSLSILEKQLGPERPELARSLHGLGNIYRRQGDLTEAEKILKRGMDLRSKSLGPTHPDLAASLQSLAEVYRDQRNFLPAGVLLNKAFEIRSKVLSPSNEELVGTQFALARLRKLEEKWGEAEDILKKVLDTRVRRHGEEHPKSVEVLLEMGEMQRVRGNYVPAETILSKALRFTENSLGEHHVEVANVLDLIASLKEEQSDFEESEALRARAEEIRAHAGAT